MAGSNEPTVLRKFPVTSPEMALESYRDSVPVVSISGLCYATPTYVGKLQQGGMPYIRGAHLTLVESIDRAVKIVTRNEFDFVLMAGPLETQLQDILNVAKAQFFSGHKSSLYVRGGMLPLTFDLLSLFGPKYDLTSIRTVRNGTEIQL